MSNNNSNNYSNNAKKPFCKVCFDAGKADTAHFIRKTPDPKSQVTCPTLLALECRYCLQHGHTVKYCTVLQKQDRDRDNKNKRVIFNTPTPTQPKNSNKFAAFEDEDEDEDEMEQQLLINSVALETQHIQQFPTLATQQFPKLATQTLATQKLTTTNLNTTINTTTTNKWAAMASVAANKPIPIITNNIYIIKQQVNTNTKWADDDELEDNEDEDEDEDLYHACVVQPIANNYTYATTYTHYTANDDDW
jgi:hypothetical protein